MRIKFYLLLMILTLSNYLHASATVTESEKSAINYLSIRNKTRSVSYTENPGEIDCYKTPTVQINDFLSDKSKVDTKTHASDPTKEKIIELTISEKITHYRSSADYMLSDRLKERNLLSLDPHDPCYGHFQALSLIDQISMQLATFVLSDHFDIDAAIASINADMLNEIGRLSHITATMFKDSFLRAYSIHQPGIKKHIALLSGTVVSVHFDSSSVESSATDSSLSGTTMLSSISNSLVEEKIDEEDEKPKVTSLIEQSGDISSSTQKTISFAAITTESQVTSALNDIKQKKDAYKAKFGIKKTKNIKTESHPELILIDNYKKALEAFKPRTKDPYDQINAAKKAYEDFIQSKEAANGEDESTHATRSQRPELKKRRSFYEMLTSTDK